MCGQVFVRLQIWTTLHHITRIRHVDMLSDLTCTVFHSREFCTDEARMTPRVSYSWQCEWHPEWISNCYRYQNRRIFRCVSIRSWLSVWTLEEFSAEYIVGGFPNNSNSILNKQVRCSTWFCDVPSQSTTLAPSSRSTASLSFFQTNTSQFSLPLSLFLTFCSSSVKCPRWLGLPVLLTLVFSGHLRLSLELWLYRQIYI